MKFNILIIIYFHRAYTYVYSINTLYTVHNWCRYSLCKNKSNGKQFRISGFAFIFFADHRPARNSGKGNAQWLGIDGGSSWTHSGQPLNFSNYKESPDNRFPYSVITYDRWKWNKDRRSSAKCAFICERDIWLFQKLFNRFSVKW